MAIARFIAQLEILYVQTLAVFACLHLWIVHHKMHMAFKDWCLKFGDIDTTADIQYAPCDVKERVKKHSCIWIQISICLKIE